MKVSKELPTEFVEGMAYAAKKLDRVMCLGDVCIDPKGKAYTHLISPTGEVSKLTLTKKIQDTLSVRVSKDIEDTVEVMKDLAIDKAGA